MKKIFLFLFAIFAGLVLAGAGCFSFTDEKEVVTTGPAGMFVSGNKGDSWQPISVWPDVDGLKSLSDVSVYRLIDDPQDPNAIYWASRNNGLLFSYNEGRSWQKAAAPLDSGFVYGAAVHPKKKCEIFATNGFQIYKSEDCARSWENVYQEDRSDARISSMRFDPSGEHTLFITKINGDLLFSNDEGVSWSILYRFGVDIGRIEPDSVRPNTWYLASRGNGLYRSDDGGKNWINLGPALQQYPGAAEYRNMVIHPAKQDTLYWISTYGILKSVDRGDSWIPYKLITSPGSVDIYGFAVNPDDDKEMYYAAMRDERSTFYKTNDGGQTWSTKKLPSGQYPVVMRAHPNKKDIIYVGFAKPLSN